VPTTLTRRFSKGTLPLLKSSRSTQSSSDSVYYTGRPVPAGRSGGQHQKTSILPGGGVEGVPRQNRPAGASPNPRPLSRPANAAAEPRWAVRPARRRITPLIHRPTNAPPNHHLRHTVRPTQRPITTFDTPSDRRTAQSPSSRRRPTDALPKNHYRQYPLSLSVQLV
jgi:hypothetical protein